MEELNNEIMDMVFELQSMHARQKVYAARLGDKDKYGFPFEPFETFSTEPLGFQETAMRLQTESIELFQFMRQVHRHSPLYYQMSSQLEKLLNQLGSACITKAVLEQQGQEFPFLNGLTIDSLREKTAFNFRKCYASYMESITTFNYNAEALGLSIRWAALDKRLLATAEKIELIKSGKVKMEVKDPVKDLNKVSEEAEKKTADQKTVSALSPNGRAFSMDQAELHRLSQSNSTQTDIFEQPEGSEASVPDENIVSEAAIEPADETLNEETEQTEEPAQEEQLSEDAHTDEEGFFGGGEDDENISYVSEDLVRRISALWNDPDLISWAYRQRATAELPP